MGLAVTDTYISLVVENHQWPLPRLQASLPENIRGQQFVLLDRQKINNIATIVSIVNNQVQLFIYCSLKFYICPENAYMYHLTIWTRKYTLLYYYIFHYTHYIHIAVS